MTRNNDTTYRQKGRAMFLATMMVLSVVAVSVAFTGGAAAITPPNVDSLSDEDPLYAGQEFNTSVDKSTTAFEADETAFLVQISRDEGNIDGYTEVLSTEDPTAETDDASDNSGELFYEIDSEGLEQGQEYALSNTSSYRGSGSEVIQEFSIINEGFSIDFDDDSVDETDTESELELDSDRSTGSYNVTVSVDGPDTFDADMINETFGADANPNYVVTDDDNVPIDGLDDYDRPDDTNVDLLDDDYVTFNIGEFSGDDIDGDDLLMDFSNLEANSGLPDAGEYEFEFYVTDTGATATDTVQISEQDEDASFDTGLSRTGAGDLAEFNLTLEDTDETWVQIGGEDSDFVEVLYLEADDEDEPIEVQYNTRLLGSTDGVDKSDVYDFSNTDSTVSGVYSADGDLTATAPSGTALFGDDGEEPSWDFDEYTNELVDEDANQQLTRPLQSTDYQIAVGGTDVNDDEAIFDADPGGEANTQLASKSLELTQPEIGDITVHTAPNNNADDTDEVSELVDAATPRDEVAIDDQLVVQVEATGIYGAIVAGPDADGSNVDSDFDRLTDGVDPEVLYNVTELDSEQITFEVAAESATGNQDANEVDIEDASESDVFVILDEANGQFFVVADTSSDDAFTQDAPDAEQDFTALMEYDADNEDDRFEYNNDVSAPFDADSSAENYPYLLQGETLSTSSDLTLAPRSIDFDNVNADEQVQAQASADTEISGETNVAPGSDVELRITGTNLRQGNDVNISGDGAISSTYDLEDQEVGNEFDIDFRVGGSSTDTADGIVVEAISDTDDGEEETNETDEPADDGEEEEPADDGEEDDSTDDGTPGFGAVVALIALIGAALLAVRRQN